MRGDEMLLKTSCKPSETIVKLNTIAEPRDERTSGSFRDAVIKTSSNPALRLLLQIDGEPVGAVQDGGGHDRAVLGGKRLTEHRLAPQPPRE